METKKIIRFLIAVFAFLTIFFSYLYLKEYHSKNVLSDDFVNSALDNLEKREIEIDKSIIVRNVPENDIYVFERSGGESYYSKVTDVIIDKLFDAKVLKTGFDVPDGAAFGLYDEKNDGIELGRIVFSNIDMSFNFTVNSVNVSGGSELSFTGDTSKIPDSARNTVDEISKALLNRENLSYRICGLSGDENLLCVSVCQTVNGYDINNSYMNFVFIDETLVKITGNCITQKVSAQYHEVLIDGVNVLYDSSLENAQKILSERIVYTLRKSEQDRYFLLPGWELVYTDESEGEKRLFVDAI